MTAQNSWDRGRKKIKCEQKAQVAKENNLKITSDPIGEIADALSFINEIARDLQMNCHPMNSLVPKLVRDKPRILITLQNTHIRKKVLTGSVRLISAEIV